MQAKYYSPFHISSTQVPLSFFFLGKIEYLKYQWWCDSNTSNTASQLAFCLHDTGFCWSVWKSKPLSQFSFNPPSADFLFPLSFNQANEARNLEYHCRPLEVNNGQSGAALAAINTNHISMTLRRSVIAYASLNMVRKAYTIAPYLKDKSRLTSNADLDG